MELIILSPVVNFGEVRRAQVAKSTLLTFSLVPLGSPKIFLRSKRESGVRKATGSYRTYRSLENYKLDIGLKYYMEVYFKQRITY